MAYKQGVGGGKVNVYGMKGEWIWEQAALLGERLWDER